jgi:hypothetical protein
MASHKYKRVVNRRQRAITNLRRRRRGLQPIKRTKDGVIKNSNESYAYTYIKAVIAKLLNLIVLKSLRDRRQKHQNGRQLLWLQEMEKQRLIQITKTRDKNS